MSFTEKHIGRLVKVDRKGLTVEEWCKEYCQSHSAGIDDKMYKKVNRLLIDAKIPYTKRLYWPEIVNNKGEVIFIPRTCEDENGLFVVKEL